MNSSSPFRHLNFSTRHRRASQRLLVVGAAFIAFTLLWLGVPRAAGYWLLLPILLCLTWAASYGWRAAVSRLIELLHSLLER